MSKIAVKQELGDHYAYGDIKLVLANQKQNPNIS